MNIIRTQLYTHCDGIHEDDFQVAITPHAGNTEKGTVLLVPAPGSSPFDAPSEGKSNQRQRLATKLKEEGYTVLTMIPPGKPNHYFSGKKSAFSFSEYASCIESVLYPDFYKKSATHIVTSSLGQIATILALQNDQHEKKHRRKIIIGAPINSLQHVLELQQNHLVGESKESLIKKYALQFGLILDDAIYDELQNDYLLNVGIKDLIDNGYKNVSIYGNDNDSYFTENNVNNFKYTHFFDHQQGIDLFNHSFSEKDADEAMVLVQQFLNDRYFSSRIGTPAKLFIEGFYKYRSGIR